MDVIDFRSDTVTRPNQAMRTAMASAEVGDDVWGDDPTVQRLEAITAERVGKEAAVFVPSGTQSNLCALLAHCQRGEEYITSQNAHCYRYEAGGAAVLGSIQPQPIDGEPDGTLSLSKVASVLKPDDPHFAQARLLCIENTTYGKALPMPYLGQVRAFADQHGLKLHLDGARAANAAVAHGVSLLDVAKGFDSVSLCLSKGLGAPVGSVLSGSAEIIAQARRWRKMLGGGMRQSGVLAAAGIYALENNVDRLAEDHDNAVLLGEVLTAAGATVTAIQTNMVFADFPDAPADLESQLEAHGVLMAINNSSARLVTHLDVSTEAIEGLGEILRKVGL
jgi:threonine aldolase